MSVDRIAAELRVQRILHAAASASMLIYCVVGYLVSSQTTTPPPPDVRAIADDPLTSPIFLALAVAAAAVAGALPVIRKRLLPPRRPAVVHNEEIGEPSSPAASAARAKLQAGQILSWALCESIAIFGLVLTILSREPWPVLAFSAAGLVNLLAYAPSRLRTEETIRAANKGSLSTPSSA